MALGQDILICIDEFNCRSCPERILPYFFKNGVKWPEICDVQRRQSEGEDGVEREASEGERSAERKRGPTFNMPRALR